MSTMFIHSLLVLLVAIHVTLACICKPMTLLQAMCYSPITVVLARVSGGTPRIIGIIPYRSYDLDLASILREEKKKLYLKNNHTSLVFPERVFDCGGILTHGLDYVIAGYVSSKGELFSTTCYYYTPYGNLTFDPHALRILVNEGDCNNV